MEYACNRNRRSCCYVPVKEKRDIWAWFAAHPGTSLVLEGIFTVVAVWAFFAIYFLT